MTPTAPTAADAARATAQAMVADLDVIFDHHVPTAEQAEVYPQIRAAFKACALEVLRLAPHSRERNSAILRLEEGCFAANAAVARRWPATDSGD